MQRSDDSTAVAVLLQQATTFNLELRGAVLREELEEIGMPANAVAQALGVPANRVSAVLKEQRGVTADTALRLSQFFGTTLQV